MKIFSLLLLWISPLLSYAQLPGTDDMILNIREPLIMHYNSIDELYNPLIINNAFSIRLKTGTRFRNVSAHIIFTNTPGNRVPEKWVALKLMSTTSNNAVINEQTKTLGVSPTILLSQPGRGMDKSIYHDFHYALIVNPSSTFIKTGTYDYSIIFTMSEP